jgi:hypothetical protein
LHHIHPPSSLSHLLSLPLVLPSHHPRRQDLFSPPVLWFCKRKSDIFAYWSPETFINRN